MEGVVERWKPSPDDVVTPPKKAEASTGDDNSVKRSASSSLNTILYGPPGTGKTYETAKRAVLICDGHAPSKREDLMKRYDELYQERRIEFVTFHQSYSYEEFIEGLRPETGNDDDTDAVQSAGFRLVARPGVLKRIAERARQRPAKANTQADYSDRRIFKVSLGRAWDPEDEDIRTEAYEKGLVSLGYGGKIDWSDPKFGSYNAVYDRWREEPGEEEATGKNPNIEMLNQLRNNMRPGDIVIASQGNKRVRAVGVVSGPYKFDPDARYHHRREVEWRWQADDDNGIEVEDIYASNFSQQSIYQLFPNKINWPNLLAYLEPATTDAPHPPHVLIIDEINRANISKVLGELITLLEEDKRAGALNELTVTLPYSGDRFTLPPNLHIVGTMNTADRSIALLDTALRRRFRFEELPPKPEILSDIVVEDIGLDSVLEAINKRLEWYLGADHLIGHGYFTSVESLEQLDEVIANKIIPLLREYFHEDLARVRAILGGGNAFLRRERISAPPGVDDAYEDERFRYVDNYIELGQYGREAYEELISSVQQQTG
ncbi:AAA family ATPase [Ruegeria pomeroyi]|nr:AAA family ATPase [Ruegeria pomeroyi]